jgi:hypothetical protein
MKAPNWQCILLTPVELPIATKVRVIGTLNFSKRNNYGIEWLKSNPPLGSSQIVTA